MLWVISILIFIRLLYWVLIFTKLARYKYNYALDRMSPVSIVICTKNNIEGLKSLLQKVLKQNHQHFEVIVVDDFSSEDVEGLIEKINDPRVIYIKAKVDIPGKKIALSNGIEMATHPWVLVTDSDCLPQSLDWISMMVGVATNQHKDIVLGYGPLRSKSFAGFIASYEAAYVAMQYLSYALWGKAYMGVGRNMLFRKDQFLASKPFDDNLGIASGDDDFIVQKMSQPHNTGICIHGNAHCISDSKDKISALIQQKVRHVSTAVAYQPIHRWMLALFGFLHVSIYGLIIGAWMVSWITMEQAFSLWLVMVSIMFIIQYACFVKLNEQQKIFHLYVTDILLSLLYVIVGIKQLTNKNFQWN